MYNNNKTKSPLMRVNRNQKKKETKSYRWGHHCRGLVEDAYVNQVKMIQEDSRNCPHFVLI